MKSNSLDYFQVIADPSRREILFLLSKNSRSINSLAENFDMSRPAVSKHIKILNETGFISIEEKGRERFCILKQDGFIQLQEWLNYYDTFWNDKLKNLKFLLDTKSKKKNNTKTGKLKG